MPRNLDGVQLDDTEALALVRAVRGPTPLEASRGLSEGPQILLKREDSGPNGAFKWRGALCACEAFRRAGATAVVTASTGNHGAATAWAAARAGMTAHVVVPEDVSGVKRDLIVAQKAVLHQCGPGLIEAAEYADSLSLRLDAPYFEDGAVAAQLSGAGTIATEIAESGADAVIVPLAVGALAGGIAQTLAQQAPSMRVIGVQVKGFDRIATVLRGERDPGPTTGSTFADGLADHRLVNPAFAACERYVDEIVVVDDDEIKAALTDLYEAEGIVVEGAGAAALAGLRNVSRDHMRRVVLLVTGRNIDPSVFDHIVHQKHEIEGDGP